MRMVLNQPGTWAKWRNIKVKVNPTHVKDHQPHPVELRIETKQHCDSVASFNTGRSIRLSTTFC